MTCTLRASALIQESVFIRPIGKVIYLAPAYIIDGDELAALTSAIRRVVEDLAPR